MSTAILTATPVVPADQVTGRAYNFTQNGTVIPPILTTPDINTTSIPCMPGDVVTGNVADTNVIGTTTSATVTGTDPTPLPTMPPTMPTVMLSFTP